MFVDTHAHLDDKRFDADREAVISRAIDAGVRVLIDPGTDVASSRVAVTLAGKHEAVYATVGVHPHEAEGLTDADYAELRALAARKKVVAVGEIGLDYYRDLSPRDVQRDAFRRQLAMAFELDLPVVIHSRDAHEDVEAVLREVSAGRALRGVLHCYSGDVAWALRAVAMGLYIGLDGPLTYPKSDVLRDVACAVPLERILLETDCPYMAPLPVKRSARNEPAYVVHVAEKLAELRGLSAEDVGRVTSLSAARLFGIPSA